MTDTSAPNYSIQPGKASDPSDHPADSMPNATEHYWGDSPSQRPAKSQTSNIPPLDSHPNDPWNKAFKD